VIFAQFVAKLGFRVDVKKARGKNAPVLERQRIVK
jgi:hypothetical protein